MVGQWLRCPNTYINSSFQVESCGKCINFIKCDFFVLSFSQGSLDMYIYLVPGIRKCKLVLKNFEKYFS